MPNFIEIGGVTRKPLVDLTRNDPNCRKYGVTSHCGERNWVTHIYISNGGGVLEDRLVLRFISIPAFLQIIPLCDTY